VRDHRRPPPTVVVGIDGSRPALDAALWAVDEAVDRDIPLRLVYAIQPSESTSGFLDKANRDLAAAECAVRYAFTAVESMEKPVKIEAEILQNRPTQALLEASRGAALLCVGSIGLNSGAQGTVGATAAALASASHCPVAVVRGHDPVRRGWVVADLDATEDSDAVLLRGLDEARLRHAPLRVLTTWQSRFTDIYDRRAVAERNRIAKAELDRRVAHWKKRCADLDVHTVAVHGNTLNYLAKNAGTIQTLVVGRDRAHGIREFVGPPGFAALHEAGCSVLICEPRNVL
jgi:nucleotide-binding universal stress UspA family protein